jgi:hypothetical protein
MRFTSPERVDHDVNFMINAILGAAGWRGGGQEIGCGAGYD